MLCVAHIEKYSCLVPRYCDQLQLGLKIVHLNSTMDLEEPALYSTAAVLHLLHPGTCTGEERFQTELRN